VFDSGFIVGDGIWEGVRLHRGFERTFSLTDIYGAEEAFVTGTFGGMTPVVHVDGRPIGKGQRGEITGRLVGLYAEAVA
jgi:branched-chain amino acid aminotransferase